MKSPPKRRVSAVSAIILITLAAIVSRQALLGNKTKFDLISHSDGTDNVLSATHSTLPAPLQNAQFNISLGCWHVRADSRGPQRFHVAAEASFDPGDRWNEVLDAINRTQSSNPGVHYILVTGKLSMLDLATQSLEHVPHDVWFCPEVLYGTPIRIGVLYAGPKFTMSIDNWLPPLTWDCNFTSGGQPVVYVVQRKETKELTGKDASCEVFRKFGSADGLFYDNIPAAAADTLRFPRTYWGCENVALFALKRAGVRLINMCPWFAPVHMHKAVAREFGRLRINHGENNVPGGEQVDINSLCRQSNVTDGPQPS